MHPLRLLLIISIALAGAVAALLGAALSELGYPRALATAAGAATFGVFMIPWTAVFLWAMRRARDIDTLIDRTRALSTSSVEASILDREYHGELDELARAIDEVRLLVVRESTWSAERRLTLEQIASALGDGLLAIGPGGKIVLANARMREIVGHRDDLTGRTLLEVARNQQLLASFERAIEGHSTTARVAIAADPERLFELRMFPVARSAEVSAVALFIDVTELERLQRIRREFLDDFSHEVRTPLAGLRSAMETLEQGPVNPADEAKLRQIMARQLTRIERLVSDLAELNRIESGELVLNPEPVELRPLLEDLATELRERSSDAHVRIKGDDVVAEADASRLQQIFGNLLDNAWKHGRGPITVEIRREGAEALVTVFDEGEGIPSHELHRIFNRFYRVDKSRSQQVPGVGLGLAIAKHLALLQEGSIRAYNRDGGGAAFEVRLPLAA